jgi:D-alanyl-D-alanine carboxypeptidase
MWQANELSKLKVAFTAEQELNTRITAQADKITSDLSSSTALTEDLKRLLAQREAEKNALGAQVQSISSTVGILDKLSKTDKQLLAKYSSVYFLNENYVPTKLSPINVAFLARPERPEYFLESAARHVNDLFVAASSSGVHLQVLSAYRSFETQAALKEGYKVTYGAGTANAFSADQGYSEHQLGTTLDFTMPQLHAGLVGFDKTPGFAWLKDHAHEFGFILSYPKGNGHFVFEPWHWRYVGVELATRLHEENRNFYDLDQRLIDTYLISFND